MEFEFVKYEKRDHLAWITLNRPQVMNALHPPCHVEMAKIWDDFVADKKLWEATISLGYDGEGPSPTIPDEVRVEAASRYIEAYERITGEPFAEWLQRTGA